MTNKKKIERLILGRQAEGITKLSVMEIIMETKISARKVDKIMNKFEKDGKVTVVESND